MRAALGVPPQQRQRLKSRSPVERADVQALRGRVAALHTSLKSEAAVRSQLQEELASLVACRDKKGCAGPPASKAA